MKTVLPVSPSSLPAFNVNKSEGFGDDFKVLPYDPNRPDPIISTRDPRYTEAGGDVLPKSTTDDLFGDPNRLKVEEPTDRAAAKKTKALLLIKSLRKPLRISLK